MTPQTPTTPHESKCKRCDGTGVNPFGDPQSPDEPCWDCKGEGTTTPTTPEPWTAERQQAARVLSGLLADNANLLRDAVAHIDVQSAALAAKDTALAEQEREIARLTAGWNAAGEMAIGAENLRLQAFKERDAAEAALAEAQQEIERLTKELDDARR